MSQTLIHANEVGAEADRPVTQKPTRAGVLLVDDHPVVRHGLKQLINLESDLLVSAEAQDFAETIAAVEKAMPAIAVVDIALADRSGIELIKELRRLHPTLPILALSMHDENLYAERALRAGAMGYVMKQEATEKVIGAIRQVLAGEVVLSPKMSARVLSRLVTHKTRHDESPLQRLTDRELEIFHLLGQGLGSRDIADRLKLSIKTVDAHRDHIKTKLGVRTSAELLRMALEHSFNDGGARRAAPQ